MLLIKVENWMPRRLNIQDTRAITHWPCHNVYQWHLQLSFTHLTYSYPTIQHQILSQDHMTNKIKSMTVRPRGIIIPDKFFAGSDCIQGGTRDTVAWSWAALRREEINWWKRSHFQFSQQPGRSMLNADQPRRRRLSSYFPLLLRVVRDQPWIGGHLHAYQPLDQGNLSFLCSILCPPRPMKGWTRLPCLITTHWIWGWRPLTKLAVKLFFKICACADQDEVNRGDPGLTAPVDQPLSSWPVPSCG